MKRNNAKITHETIAQLKAGGEKLFTSATSLSLSRTLSIYISTTRKDENVLTPPSQTNFGYGTTGPPGSHPFLSCLPSNPPSAIVPMDARPQRLPRSKRFPKKPNCAGRSLYPYRAQNPRALLKSVRTNQPDHQKSMPRSTSQFPRGSKNKNNKEIRSNKCQFEGINEGHGQLL
ncbi:unnamed protein product [Tuber aestivum]|uniref:Uncharacterized protein n=1 Tax=Tuber aestivum TaxID=59557 RepID=A0A292PJI4_9PEZI|nr:unnamed protein product [Tuber aestivum]